MNRQNQDTGTINNINGDLNDLKLKLESIRESQPNVYRLWKLYLYKKEMEYNRSVEECKIMLNEIENVTSVLSIRDLKSLFCLRRINM
jgi:hypothetical protein